MSATVSKKCGLEAPIGIVLPDEISAAARRLRRENAKPISVERAANALAQVCRVIAYGSSAIVDATISSIASQRGWAERLVCASLEALCLPLSDDAQLEAVGGKIKSGHEVIGFIMPGNIPGAGLHELILTLLTGQAALIKTSGAEPFFFDCFARLLTLIDPELGERIAISCWNRDSASHFKEFRDNCDRIVALGNDETIAILTEASKPNRDFAGFGARVSGAFVTASAATKETAWHLAHDVALFEQCGCLSPQHAFVEESTEDSAAAFAAHLGDSLDILSKGPLPPSSTIPFNNAVRIRSIRERARWRSLSDSVRLYEGPLPGWTVIYDRSAGFQVSPGFRTVFVSPADDLERRLAPVRGKIEAFAMAFDRSHDYPKKIEHVRSLLHDAGATYLCDAGSMQSPPLDWSHGGGAFLRSLSEAR